MSNPIQNIQLQFSCQENWDAMAEINGGRHCDKCDKKVYDFTDSKPEEFIRLIRESNYSICGRYRSEHVAVKPALLPFWKKWVSAAMVLIGFNLAGIKAIAQNKTGGTSPDSVNADNDPGYKDFKGIAMPGDLYSLTDEALKANPDAVVISVEEKPVFRGGMEKFYTYTENIMRYPEKARAKKLTGRIIVSFIVEKDGSLTGAKVLRGLGSGLDEEALRIVQNSPKWIPGRHRGMPVRVEYALPLYFKLPEKE